jgi:hypothetical protein
MIRAGQVPREAIVIHILYITGPKSRPFDRRLSPGYVLLRDGA